MGTTFNSDSPRESHLEASCCLCAQMAPSFSSGVPTEAERADLKAHANPSCSFCGGTGVEMVDDSILDRPHFSSVMAEAVLNALGTGMCSIGSEQACGEAPISVFRRSCVKALARDIFTSHAASEGYNKARAINGRIQRGCYAIDRGIEASQVREHIERLLSFAAAEQAKGATLIRWY